MTTLVSAILVILTAALVFAAGWRMLAPPNSAAGGTVALFLFILNPAIISAVQTSSLWDALFVMFFLGAWLWMEHWSLFMRSWVLAGIFCFGLWVGSPFVLWGLIAMVPWVIFNRRPFAAVGSLATVLFGGVFIFAVTWGFTWFMMPGIGQPLFMQWVRWKGLQMPPSISLPWLLLTAGAVIDRLREMLKDRRSDATVYAAVLVVATAFLGSSSASLALIALSAPLIARLLAKKEFLFHRRVRWVAGLTLALTLLLGYVFKGLEWPVTGSAMLIVVLGSWWIHRKSKLPRFMAAEAGCVGAYVAESLFILLHL